MIELKKITPLFRTVIVTAECFEEDEVQNGIMTPLKGTLKPYQHVVAVGGSVQNIKAGDYVALNLTRYANMKHEKGSLKDGVICDNPVIDYNPPRVFLNGVEHFLLQDSDVDFKIDEYEEHKSSDITVVKNRILLH